MVLNWDFQSGAGPFNGLEYLVELHTYIPAGVIDISSHIILLELQQLPWM